MTEHFHHYAVLERLAIGGMATIDRVGTAAGAGERQHFVLKRLLPERARDEEWRAMFRHEMALTSALQHENCVAAHEAGEHDGELYLVLHEVGGPHLGQLFGAGLRRQTPMPLPICVEILRQLSLAMAHVHQWPDGPVGSAWRALHRDICPQNVLVGTDGIVKLIDYGLAYSRAAAAVLGPITVRGRPGYMSPEQCRGDALDPRSDIFAWGIVAYELLSRRRLFNEGEAEAQMAANERAEFVALRERNQQVDARLEHIVQATLVREPALRTFSMATVSQALSAWQRAEGHGSGAPMVAAWMKEDALMRREQNGEIVLSSARSGEP